MDQRFRRGMRAAEKMVLWDSCLRGESLKAIGRTFGKPSSLFIASWPRCCVDRLRPPTNNGQIRILGRVSWAANDPKRTLRISLQTDWPLLKLRLAPLEIEAKFTHSDRRFAYDLPSIKPGRRP